MCRLAGYNNVDVADFLLENGADVNAQDKGGLIPLHNASSYGVSRVCVHLLPGCSCFVHNVHWFVGGDDLTGAMSHIVNSCPLTKFDGGLLRLHEADEAAVDWLTTYGS